MNARILALLSLPIVALASACHTAPTPLDRPASDVFTTLPAAEFPGADALLQGFDGRQNGTAWDSGDRVLFGLRLRKGETVHRWLLSLTLVLGDRLLARVGSGDDGTALDTIMPQHSWSYTAEIADERREIPIKSKMSLVSVEVYDAHGARLGKSLVHLPRDLMAHGLLAGIECALRHGRGGGDFRSFDDEGAVRPMAKGLIALIALLNVVQNDEVLEEYFWLVVQQPSLWSVIAGLGVSATLTASLEQSIAVTDLPMQLPQTHPAYAMPLRVDVNDTPALLADVIAVDPARPYGLCAGIVAASARHPTNADIRFDVQLLAARLGR